MMKKTRKTQRIKQGGKSFIERNIGIDANTSGPYIADDIDMNVRSGNKLGLLTEYEQRKINAEKRYEETERKFNENHNQRLKEDTLTFKFKQESNLQWHRFITNLGTFTMASFTIIKSILIAIWTILITIFNNIKEIGSFIVGKLIDFIGKLSNSSILNTIVKTLIVLLIVLLLIFGAMGFFSSSSSNTGTTSISNATTNSLNIANTNTFFIKTQQQPSILGLIGTSIGNLVPDRYRIQFTAFKNNVNSVFGNDLVDKSIYNIPRGEIKTGRIDNIMHIDIKNDKDKIYTMVKPKQIVIDVEKYINNDMSKSHDFYKLPENIRNKYKQAIKKFIINAEQTNGLFTYPAQEMRYEGDDGIPILLRNTNIKNPYKDTADKKGYILNEIKQPNYLFDNSSNIDPVYANKRIVNIGSAESLYASTDLNSLILDI